MGWGHMTGYGGGFFGWFYMLIFWAVIILGIVLLAMWLLKQSRGGRPGTDDGESPLDILKKRYAKGEIDKEEFEEKKKTLSE